MLEGIPADAPTYLGVFKCQLSQLEFDVKVACVDSELYMVTLKPKRPLDFTKNVIQHSITDLNEQHFQSQSKINKNPRRNISSS
jgi:hypothetical protein